jgi:uncharacterized membrane protein YqjE
MDGMTVIVALVVVIALLFLMIKGVIKTFKRQPIVAILCVIFLTPIYLIWAFIELFTGGSDGDTRKLKNNSEK